MRMDALFVAARLMITHGAHDAARVPLTEMLAIARQERDARQTSFALTGLGLIAWEQCAFAEARGLHEEAIIFARASGDQFALGQALNNMSTILVVLGETRRARICLEECLALTRQVGDVGNLMRAQRWHGALAILEGDTTRARAILAEALAFHHAGKAMLGIADCLEMFAALHALKGEYARALRVFGAVATIRETIAAPCPLPLQRWLSDRLEPARHALGDATSAVSEQEGRALSVEDAIATALATGADEPVRTKGDAPPFGGLSAREREVVALLVTGKTNRRIAEELFIVEKTVELHLTHCMRKLGLHTRAELTVWAVNNGLADRSATSPVSLSMDETRG